MKNELSIVKYIKEHGLDNAIDTFKLTCKDYGYKILLKYSQIESDMSFQEVQECRGLILEVRKEIMAEKDFMFFWGGEFSQWYPSNFTIDGVEYNCAEQYMMQQKAILFEDEEMEAKIMATTSPRKQKQFGKQVKNFVKETWEEVARDIVKRANIAKFTQNPKLQKAFVISEGREIVEASPEDKIWGIGLQNIGWAGACAGCLLIMGGTVGTFLAGACAGLFVYFNYAVIKEMIMSIK